MDPKFQTSFIPKQSLTEPSFRPRSSINLLLLISLVILFGTLALFGGLYFYKKTVTDSINAINVRLSAARADIDPTLVAKLERLDLRIESAKDILGRHLALTTFFNSLSTNTLKGVSFQSFDYVTTDTGALRVSLKGQAAGFSTVALESDQLAKDTNIKEPVFSDIGLDPFGHIIFNLNLLIDPAAISYQMEVTPKATDSIPVQSSETLPSQTP